MRTRVGCSWCHDWATVGAPPWPTCGGCGHRADVARMLCDCARCRPLRPVGFEGERFTFEPASLVAYVRAELKKPCPHGIPREEPCAACAEEVPF